MHKDLQLFFFSFRDTEHTLHPSLFKHLKLRDLFEKLLEWKMILDFIYLQTIFPRIISRNIRTLMLRMKSINEAKKEIKRDV